MRNWLIAIRKARGLTQIQLADIVRMSPSYIALIETGERKVPVWTAKRIASALGFEWQRFYEDENEKETTK